MTQGVLYVATGQKYAVEALNSCILTRKFNPSVNIAIATDNVDYFSDSTFIFDKIIGIADPSYSYGDKILGLYDLPYDHTIFLDTDAFAIRDLDSLFKFSVHADVCACFAPVSHPPGWTSPDVPQLFPELNSGVLSIKKSKVALSLIQSWNSLYKELCVSHRQSWDQASLRHVLWDYIINYKLSFLPFPPEVNLRTSKPWTASRGQPVFIIHGRFDQEELDSFSLYLNSDIDRFRTWSIWKEHNPQTSIRPRFDRTFN